MFVSKELKLIYIIVPGTGSNSFHREFKRKNPDFLQHVVPDKNNPAWKLGSGIGHRSHWTARMAREILEPDVWNTYEKFAFVRHPYWWARSIFRKGGIKNAVGINNDGTFTEYLKRLEKTPYFWFCDTDGTVLLDKIYRTEDLAELCKQWNIKYTHANKTNNKKEAEKTDEVAEILKKKFSREYTHYPGISVFGDEYINIK